MAHVDELPQLLLIAVLAVQVVQVARQVALGGGEGLSVYLL
jgi:hypothetical protein